MKNLAPHIPRQRLIIEGIYDKGITCNGLKSYLVLLAEQLGMHVVYGPIVIRGAEKIDPKYAGFEGHMIWAESGVAIYTWEDGKFFSVDIYSCKRFDIRRAVGYTRNFMKAEEITWRGI